MAITGWGNFRPLSALSLDAGPLPAPPGLLPAFALRSPVLARRSAVRCTGRRSRPLRKIGCKQQMFGGEKQLCAERRPKRCHRICPRDR